MTIGDVNFLGTTSLGKINRWEAKKTSTLTPISMPAGNSGETEAVDTMGVIAYINFDGKFTGSFMSIQDKMFALKNILDGQQIATTTLYSPFVNTTDQYDTRRQGAQNTVTSLNTDFLNDSTAFFVIQGIHVGYKVKNLTTGHVSTVKTVYANGIQLELNDDIFSAIGEAYAVSANINVKIIDFNNSWVIPGINWCTYRLTVIQVR